ncbi:hypothetical protein [Micromonospora sp. DT233]|uniref:hypothetical protein n=1 Tax=Micromonospora sp. DT233 TaxID=3393432 RepID=UPI003CFB0989
MTALNTANTGDNPETTKAIDAIDDQIILLVRARHDLALAQRRARMERGAPTLQLAQEVSVAQRYSAGLGRTGTTLAALLLQACRHEDALPPATLTAVEPLLPRGNPGGKLARSGPRQLAS